jgi:Skp family chaperone for outer membrane proteins
LDRHGKRRWAGLALAAALALGVRPGLAADIRIGYIDSAKIFESYTVAKEAQQRFDRQVQAWREEAQEKERAVNALRAELKDQGPILSAAKRQEKEEALQRSISEYEGFIQSIWGPSGRAAAENERLTRDIVNQIREVVEKIATEQAYQLVLDAASGFVIFADKELDLTPQVLTELNTRAGTASGAR